MNSSRLPLKPPLHQGQNPRSCWLSVLLWEGGRLEREGLGKPRWVFCRVPWGNGELWWVLEHESDTSQSLWRKDLRCGSSRGRACTHEYAHLSATHARTCTHTLQWAHVHMEELVFIQPHTFSHTDRQQCMCPHTNLFTYASRHPQCTLWYR